MRFCRVRMVPFVGERRHGGRDDREDNNEIHGNLAPLPRCGARTAPVRPIFTRGEESYDFPKNRAPNQKKPARTRTSAQNRLTSITRTLPAGQHLLSRAREPATLSAKEGVMVCVTWAAWPDSW